MPDARLMLTSVTAISGSNVPRMSFLLFAAQYQSSPKPKASTNARKVWDDSARRSSRLPRQRSPGGLHPKSGAQKRQPHDRESGIHIGAAPALDLIDADGGVLQLEGNLAALHLPDEDVGAAVASKTWYRPFKLGAMTAGHERFLERELRLEMRERFAKAPSTSDRRLVSEVVNAHPALAQDQRRAAAWAAILAALLDRTRIDTDVVMKCCQHSV